MSMSWTDNPHLPDPQTQPEYYDGVAPKRLVAWIVDVAITLALCLLILPFTAFTGIFFFPFLWLCVGFLYRWMTLSGGSATWGMRLMSIEIRRGDGEKLDGGTALLHTLGYSLSIGTAIVQAGSMVLMLATERGQGLSDLALGTVALNRRAW